MICQKSSSKVGRMNINIFIMVILLLHFMNYIGMFSTMALALSVDSQSLVTLEKSTKLLMIII